MRLHRFARADAFLANAEAWLARREAEHNLILGLAGGLARQADEPAELPPYFALVRVDDEPVAAALQTPPQNLLLSEIDDPGALELFADDMARVELPGVTGPPDAAERFGEIWTAEHGGRAEVLMRERIYRLATVVAPPSTSGTARRATGVDRPLLTEWVADFHAEALPAEADRARRGIAGWDPETGRQFWIWEDGGRPVSLVGAGNPTPRGMRIGPVYTPPGLRGRGYATSLTAFVSQRMLDDGRSFCFLYTDLANPTSNHIYQAIGYEPVSDALMVAFRT